MKKPLAICLLIIALSFPARGGHVFPGNVACSCGTPGCLEDYPGECGGKTLSTPADAPDRENAPDSGTAELGIVLVALLMWLRLKA